MVPRVLILAVSFLCASVYVSVASKVEPTIIRQPLSAFPLKLASWEGRDTVGLSNSTVEALGVNDYLSRVYSWKGANLGLYIGFYESQRQSEGTIHSPMVCLPGAGWNPADRSQLMVPVKSGSGGAREIEVNRVIIEKGKEQQLVLYWYQSHGRVVASEYWGKLYTVLDAIRINRTDAALVRIISPILAPGPQGISLAESAATDFVQKIFPLLSQHLPE